MSCQVPAHTSISIAPLPLHRLQHRGGGGVEEVWLQDHIIPSTRHSQDQERFVIEYILKE